DEEISKVGPRMPPADRALAARIERREIRLESLVLDRHFAVPRVGVSHPAIARRKDTIEKVDSGPHGSEQIGRRSHAHKIARLLRGKESGRGARNGSNRLFGPAPRPPADGVARKVEVDERAGRAAPQFRICPALKDSEEQT